MIIELVGLPGSGKTTIARIIYKELKKFGLDVKYPNVIIDANKFVKCFLTFVSVIIHPVVFLKIFFKFYKEHSFPIKDFDKNIRNLSLFNSLYHQKRKKNEIFIFDEFLLQSIWATTISNYHYDYSELLTFFLKKNTEPYFLIYVSCDFVLLKERLLKRNDKGRFEKKLGTRDMGLDKKNLENMLSLLRDTRNIKIFEIQNNHDKINKKEIDDMVCILKDSMIA